MPTPTLTLTTDRVIIVADVGSNHNGDLDTAKALIVAAARAGADVVKFQTFRARTLVHPTDPSYKLVERCELPFEWHAELASYAREQGIAWTSTPSDFEALDLIAKLAPPFLKIGSDDLTNHPLIRAAVGTGLPLVLSCGMATRADIDDALGCVPHERLWLLYCVSVYPAEVRDYALMSLRLLDYVLRGRPMATLGGGGGRIGLSDHTLSMALPGVAITYGARMVEKHLTLSRAQEGPDHGHSLEPGEFALMVKGVREAEAVMADKRDLPLGRQEELRRTARRGLYYARDLARGAEVQEDDLIALRPPSELGPQDVAELVGRRLKQAKAALAPVCCRDLEKRAAKEKRS